MEDDVDEDVSYSGEKWPLLNEEPRGKQYITVQVYLCEAQHEWRLEKWFDLCPVEVDGKIYPREEWNDLELRKMKSLLPPWLQHPSERTSDWTPSERSHGMVVDYEEIYREEDKRMKENKMNRFVFLVEEDRRTEAETWFPGEGVQPDAGARWVEDEPREVEARRENANEAAQQETAAGVAVGEEEAQQDELFFLDYQGEREEQEDTVHTVQEDELQSVLEATENMDLVEGPRREPATGSEDEDELWISLEKDVPETIQASSGTVTSSFLLNIRHRNAQLPRKESRVETFHVLLGIEADEYDLQEVLDFTARKHGVHHKRFPCDWKQRFHQRQREGPKPRPFRRPSDHHHSR